MHVVSRPLAIALHGGAGTITKKAVTAEKERVLRAELVAARDHGWHMLTVGAAALEVVVEVAARLEDCPLFNAGRGSVYTADGTHELDAAVMCGATRRAGAVAGVRTVRHPARLALRVLESDEFVFLVGQGAEAFAATTDVERVDPAWFGTEERHRQLLQARASGRAVSDHDGFTDQKSGTIGVVALDADGHVAAATSTGGLTNKRYGRVGDTPVIGAGTYADDATCAVSCTGYGEEFVRAVAAHDVAARMRYAGADLRTAATDVIGRALPEIGGRGGLVAVDRAGHVALPFNTTGMYRAWRSSLDSVGDGVGIFRD